MTTTTTTVTVAHTSSYPRSGQIGPVATRYIYRVDGGIQIWYAGSHAGLIERLASQYPGAQVIEV